jgi:hypothetical protein
METGEPYMWTEDCELVLAVLEELEEECEEDDEDYLAMKRKIQLLFKA